MGIKKKKKFYFFAVAAHGSGISGGDRIFIEFAKRWSKKHVITIYVWEEGRRMLERQGVVTNSSLKIKTINVGFWCKLGFLACYVGRIIQSIVLAFKVRLNNSTDEIIYSASEFWMDSLPSLILKIRYPRVKWLAAWYQTAPSPLKGFSEIDRKNTYRMKAFLYWFVQLPIKPLVSRFADNILVNNKEERKMFDKEVGQKIIVVFGAVDTESIRRYLLKSKPEGKIFDAVFQGRFHPQKGVVELIDIWKKVVEHLPSVRLAMIGDGPLMGEVREKIKKYNLVNNVELFGYLFDGPKKYKVFSQSKIVLHPSFYDSGGMASAEAMAFGLPGIAFDLKSYKSYYPYGMIKIEKGDLALFAKKIIFLLKHSDTRRNLGREAKDWVFKDLSWDKRSGEVLRKII